MTFGDPRDFAIEAYHEPFGPKWGGFGRMAIDIQGVRLGDIRENHCSLFHAVDCFREVYPQTISSGNITVTLPATNSQMFYRLKVEQ